MPEKTPVTIVFTEVSKNLGSAFGRGMDSSRSTDGELSGPVGELDRTDLRMALVAVSYYQRAHVLSKRPVPPAADRLAEHLHEALSARGHDCVVRQPQWLTTRQVATRLGCSERTARRLAERLGRRIGRCWFIAADALPRKEDQDTC